MNANPHSADWVRDQLEIRALIENYSDAACRRDVDALMALWAERARWSVPDMPGLESVVGKSEIREKFVAAQAAFPFVWLVGIPGDVAISGDSASARVYTTEVLRAVDGTIRRAVGRYDDRFERIAGRWLFTERVWHLQHIE